MPSIFPSSIENAKWPNVNAGLKLRRSKKVKEERTFNEQLTPRRKSNNIQLLVLDSSPTVLHASINIRVAKNDECNKCAVKRNGSDQNEENKRNENRIENDPARIRSFDVTKSVSYVQLITIRRYIFKKHVSSDIVEKNASLKILSSLAHNRHTSGGSLHGRRNGRRSQKSGMVKKGSGIRELTSLFLTFLLFVLQ